MKIKVPLHRLSAQEPVWPKPCMNTLANPLRSLCGHLMFQEYLEMLAQWGFANVLPRTRVNCINIIPNPIAFMCSEREGGFALFSYELEEQHRTRRASTEIFIK